MAFSGSANAREETLVREMLPRVRAFARARLRDASTAEDFAQHAMELTIAALRQGRIEDPSRAGGWVLRTCRNLLQADWRKQVRRERLTAVAVVDEPQHVELPERGHEMYRLAECITRLRDRARRVLALTFCEELRSPEVAERLALTASNVRVIRKRTLAALRKCMEGHDA